MKGGHTVRGAALAAALALVGYAPARVDANTTIDRGASVLIFPNIVVDAARDTVLQITNLSNQPELARCFYVNGAPISSTLPPSPSNPPLCTTEEFSITLTRQQPTYWVASQGRPVKRRDAFTGTDPGIVPAVPAGFTGSLYCVNVDATGVLFSANSLSGVATIKSRSGADVAKYNAVGLFASDINNNDTDQTLCVGGGVSAQCPNGPELDGCPGKSFLDGGPDFIQDPLAGAGSSVETVLTMVPCTHDFANQVSGPTFVELETRDEFGLEISHILPLPCWTSATLSSLIPGFTAALVTYGVLTITPIGPGRGFVTVAQEFHNAGALTASVGVNTHSDGIAPAGDVITLPAPPP